MKPFHNPHLADKLTAVYRLDTAGSNFPRELYDPHGFDERDYYDTMHLPERREAKPEPAAPAPPAASAPPPLEAPTPAPAPSALAKPPEAKKEIAFSVGPSLPAQQAGVGGRVAWALSACSLLTAVLFILTQMRSDDASGTQRGHLR